MRNYRQQHVFQQETVSAQPTQQDICEAYRHWVVVDPLTWDGLLDDQFYRYSAWGEQLTGAMALWLQQVTWSGDDQGPLQRSSGFSWTELAISFMLWWQGYLPVLRTDNDNQELVVVVGSHQEAIDRGITLKELTRSALRLLDHACALSPYPLFPKQRRKRCSSIKILGAQQYGMGWACRPQVPCQSGMVDYLQQAFATATGRKLLTLPDFGFASRSVNFLPGSFASRQQLATHKMNDVRRARRHSSQG